MRDVSDALRRYVVSWGGPWPQSALTTEILRTDGQPARQIQRRTLIGTGPRAPLIATRNLWLGARHALRRTYPQPPASALEAFERCTQVPVPVQRRRLLWLARRGVPPREALQLGLLLDDGATRWLQYVWSTQTGWNAAASASSAGPALKALSDKVATCHRLAPLGVRCAPGLTVSRGTAWDLPAAVDAWLERWPVVHGKRRAGSQGEGAFELRRRAGELELRPYGEPMPVPDPLAWLQRSLAHSDYVIQPRLVSHPVFDRWAEPDDVVTVRVVTRDVRARRGTGRPQVFSVCLELPQRVDGKLAYRMAAVDERGLVTGGVIPWWLCEQRRLVEEKVAPLRSLDLPDLAVTSKLALRAHEAFRGVFAIAWDIAMTDHGPVLLEGNTGFGTTVPQWLAGPILAGVG